MLAFSARFGETGDTCSLPCKDVGMIERLAPTVSVIIPTYNRKQLLMRAINSALSQTLNDIEVIIVDDGSTDGTSDLFANAQEARVYYHQMPHRGACAARNVGLDLAKGKYIAFLDSDDVWLPSKLEKQYKQLEESGADVVCCAFERYDSECGIRVPGKEKEQHRINYRQLLGGNCVSTQTLFGRSECMKATRFDETFPRMQDWEYAIRLAATWKLVFFPDVLAKLYVQPDSISRKPELGLKAMRLLLKKYRYEFVESMANTLLMLSTVESFASQCGQKCSIDYLKAISIRRNCRDNTVLLRRSVALILGDASMRHTRRESL